MKVDLDIGDFSRRDITLLGKTKPVLLTGVTGPAVIVIHEVYGFTPTLARFCRWVRDAGFRVYAPILFGSPDAGNTEKPTLRRILSLCVSRVHAACGQQIQPGDGMAARPRASCPSGMRWPRRRSYRHVHDRRLCTFQGARSGRARY